MCFCPPHSLLCRAGGGGLGLSSAGAGSRREGSDGHPSRFHGVSGLQGKLALMREHGSPALPAKVGTQCREEKWGSPCQAACQPFHRVYGGGGGG